MDLDTKSLVFDLLRDQIKILTEELSSHIDVQIIYTLMHEKDSVRLELFVRDKEE